MLLGRKREEEDTWQATGCRSSSSARSSQLTVLYPSPLGSHAHQNNHKERVDIGTPGGCGLGDKKIPEYA